MDSARDNMIYLSNRAISASERVACDEDSRAVTEAVRDAAFSLKKWLSSGPAEATITLSYASVLVRVIRLAADLAGEDGKELIGIAIHLSQEMTRIDRELEARLDSGGDSGANMRRRMS